MYALYTVKFLSDFSNRFSYGLFLSNDVEELSSQCQFWRISIKKCDHGQIDTCTDANWFHNLSHAV